MRGERRAALRRRVRGLIRRGTSGPEVVGTVLAGAALAVFPVLGITSLMCAYVAHRLRLNHLLIQAVNYLALPLQLALFVPFVALGERLLGREGTMPTSLGRMLEMLSERPSRLFGMFLEATGIAVGAWCLTVLPLLGVILWRLARNRPSFPAEIPTQHP
jgi:uncharacterized protein (DUF2062 family)